MSDFQDYLHRKKIDSEAFRKADPAQWQVWKEIFDQVHPDSFTAQKLYLINPLRRQYPFVDVQDVIVGKDKPKKPVMKPKAVAVEPGKDDNKVQDKSVKPKPKMPIKPKMKPKISLQASKTEGEEAFPQEQKPKMAKPKISIKTKASSQANEEEKEAKGVSKEEEKPKMSKPKIKPRPVIKKRPKTD